MTNQAPAKPPMDVSRATPAPGSVRALMEATVNKKRFDDVLGKRAPQFIASLNTLVYASDQLRRCDPMTVISAALQAAALDLPIDPNLGFAYIIPYGSEAHFQAGWKTYIQLAHRTRQYRNIHVTEVYPGEIKSVNRFTGIPVFGERSSDLVVGYMAYFQLVNGFEKYLYMSVDQLQAHGKQYSKTYNHTDRHGKEDSKWKTDFPAMAKKTVIKQLLSKWGPLSIEIQKVLAADTPPEEAGEIELTPEQRASMKAALEQEDDGFEPSDAAKDKVAQSVQARQEISRQQHNDPPTAAQNAAADQAIVEAEKIKA